MENELNDIVATTTQLQQLTGLPGRTISGWREKGWLLPDGPLKPGQGKTPVFGWRAVLAAVVAEQLMRGGMRPVVIQKALRSLQRPGDSQFLRLLNSGYRKLVIDGERAFLAGPGATFGTFEQDAPAFVSLPTLDIGEILRRLCDRFKVKCPLKKQKKRLPIPSG